jgi:hypothetical protein
VRWDAGTFHWVADEPEEVAVSLEGGRLRGVAVLRRDPGGDWTLAWTGG